MSFKYHSSNSSPKINAIDLFCGVGGLTYGLTRAGIKVKAGMDVDPNCRFAFESNNAAKFLLSDVSLTKSSELKEILKGSATTLLAGCAPCQPFSTYSRSGRNRNYHKQWPLLLHFGRLVSEVRPTLITIENVPQIKDHEVFLRFLDMLDGYFFWWSIVDCSALGVPQTRKRLVLIGSTLGSDKLELATSSNSNVTVRETIGHLRSLAAGEQDPNDALHAAPSLSSINLQRIKASIPGGSWKNWPESLRSKCHTKQTGQTYPSVYGRMEWDRPSPTITTQCFGYGNGRFGHPEQNRAISLREAAMLQTFPENYKFVESPCEVKFNRLGRLIGNAVPVNLGHAIGTTLLDHVRHYNNLNRVKS